MAKTYSAAQLLALPPAPQSDWVVVNLLRTGRRRPSLLCGYPGAGKSTLAHQLALAVGNGVPFLNRATSHGHVILWLNEDSAEDVSEDLQRAGLTADTKLTISLPQYGDNNFDVLKRALNDHPDTRLVIIETLADFLNVEDISNNDDTRRGMQQFCDFIMADHQQTSFLMLHHFNKSSAESELAITKILGGTAIAALSDARIYLRLASDDDPRRIIHAEARKGVGIEKTYLHFDPETLTAELGQTLAGERAAIRESAQQEKQIQLDAEIIKTVKAHPGISKGEVVNAVKGNAQKVNRTIDELIDMKTIFCKLGGEKGNAKLLYANDADVYADHSNITEVAA
jgi:hypothetical protein